LIVVELALICNVKIGFVKYDFGYAVKSNQRVVQEFSRDEDVVFLSFLLENSEEKNDSDLIKNWIRKQHKRD